MVGEVGEGVKKKKRVVEGRRRGVGGWWGVAWESNPASRHYRCSAEMQGHPDTCHGQPAESPRMKLTRCA